MNQTLLPCAMVFRNFHIGQPTNFESVNVLIQYAIRNVHTSAIKSHKDAKYIIRNCLVDALIQTAEDLLDEKRFGHGLMMSKWSEWRGYKNNEDDPHLSTATTVDLIAFLSKQINGEYTFPSMYFMPQLVSGFKKALLLRYLLDPRPFGLPSCPITDWRLENRMQMRAARDDNMKFDLINYVSLFKIQSHLSIQAFAELMSQPRTPLHAVCNAVGLPAEVGVEDVLKNKSIIYCAMVELEAFQLGDIHGRKPRFWGRTWAMLPQNDIMGILYWDKATSMYVCQWYKNDSLTKENEPKDENYDVIRRGLSEFYTTRGRDCTVLNSKLSIMSLFLGESTEC